MVSLFCLLGVDVARAAQIIYHWLICDQTQGTSNGQTSADDSYRRE